MTPKRTSPSQRLSQLFKEPAHVPSMDELLDALKKKLPEEIALDLDAAEARNLLACSALTLNPNSPVGVSVAKAFSLARLDPENPVHWRLLLELFCLAHFGGRGRGRPKTPKADPDIQLIKDITQVKARKPNISASSICRILREAQLYKQRYKGTSKETLRKAERKIRAYQEHLAKLVDPVLRGIQSSYEKKGQAWSSELENKFRDNLIDIFSGTFVRRVRGRPVDDRTGAEAEK